MNFLNSILIGLCAFSLICGCSSTSKRSANILSLDRLDRLNLKEINLNNVISELGTPDLRSYTDSGKSQEALVFFEKSSPPRLRLSLIFDTNTQLLISATWFVSVDDPESDFSRIADRDAAAGINLNSPDYIKEGAFGMSLNKYKSSASPIAIYTSAETKFVQAIAWNYSEPSKQPGRKPTSH